MDDHTFPIDYFTNALVRVFDTMKYQDNNYDRHERVKNLRYAYSKAANHFAQPLQQDILQNTVQASPKKIDATLRSMTRMVVYCWPKVSPQVMADLTIFYSYFPLLDDCTNDPHPEMASFFEDSVHGRQQKHLWWRLMNGYLPRALSHYGSFCAFNIIRSTMDFFQGCWIEQYNFHGFPESHDYPPFLRRLSGLGQCVGGTLFPAEQFDERALFTEITTTIAQVEHLEAYLNDLMSFYKEFDEPRDQTSLVKNFCHVEGIHLHQALDKLANDVILRCGQLAVFEGKTPEVSATVEAFVQGFVTWHLCDERYRMDEVYEHCGDSPGAVKFRHYYEDAMRVGDVDPKEWAVPPFPVLAEEAKRSSLWSALPSLVRLLPIRS